MGDGRMATIAVLDVLDLTSVMPLRDTTLVAANPDPAIVTVAGETAGLTVILLMVCALTTAALQDIRNAIPARIALCVQRDRYELEVVGVAITAILVGC